MTPTKSNSVEWSALVFALIFPTVLTWVYFIALAGSDPWMQKGAYGIGKVIQFAFPLVFVVMVRKERLQFRGLDTSGLVLAIGFGLLVAGSMLGLYYLWLKPAGFFAGVIPEVKEKLKGFEITSLAAYAVLAAFYSLVHSLLEEYYWRWFVFGQLARGCKLPLAIAVASLGFAAHHVLEIIQIELCPDFSVHEKDIEIPKEHEPVPKRP